MSLRNLVGVSLQAVKPSSQSVQRLLSAASTQITDAEAKGISSETRFGAAYSAIRMLADVGLNAQGRRVR